MPHESTDLGKHFEHLVETVVESRLEPLHERIRMLEDELAITRKRRKTIREIVDDPRQGLSEGTLRRWIFEAGWNGFGPCFEKEGGRIWILPSQLAEWRAAGNGRQRIQWAKRQEKLVGERAAA